MKTQRHKKASGEWIVSCELDKFELRWIGGNCVLTCHDWILLDVQPNHDSQGRAIPVYRVKVSIEAVRDEDVDLHGKVIK